MTQCLQDEPAASPSIKRSRPGQDVGTRTSMIEPATTSLVIPLGASQQVGSPNTLGQNESPKSRIDEELIHELMELEKTTTKVPVH